MTAPPGQQPEPGTPLPIRVSAPATSANLGPGFDCLAMALTLRNELLVSAGTGRVHVAGEGAGDLPEDHSNLVARAFDRAAPGRLHELDLACVNRIPPARGLGSSTAAAATGLVAGWRLVGEPWDEQRLFHELAELDGHPDNAVACAYGGVALAWPSSRTANGQEAPRAARLPAQPWLEPLVLIPERQVPTAQARQALPAQYARAATTRAIALGSALAAGLALADGEIVLDAIERDVVHEQQRAGLVPELAQVRQVLQATGSEGRVRASLSGAGPTILVWCPVGTRQHSAALLAEHLPELRALRLAIDPAGAGVDQTAAH